MWVCKDCGTEITCQLSVVAVLEGPVSHGGEPRDEFVLDFDDLITKNIKTEYYCSNCGNYGELENIAKRVDY